MERGELLLLRTVGCAASNARAVEAAGPGGSAAPLWGWGRGGRRERGFERGAAERPAHERMRSLRARRPAHKEAEGRGRKEGGAGPAGAQRVRVSASAGVRAHATTKAVAAGARGGRGQRPPKKRAGCGPQERSESGANRRPGAASVRRGRRGWGPGAYAVVVQARGVPSPAQLQGVPGRVSRESGREDPRGRRRRVLWRAEAGPGIMPGLQG